MIKIDSNVTMISGELTTILSEMTTVLNRLYIQMKETLGEEQANEYLATIGRLAIMPEDELKKALTEE